MSPPESVQEMKRSNDGDVMIEGDEGEMWEEHKMISMINVCLASDVHSRRCFVHMQ